MMRSPAAVTSERLVELVEALDQLRLVAGGDVAALREDRHHLAQGETDLADMFGRSGQAAEPSVPDRQAVARVEHGDALVHLRQRGLQHVLVMCSASLAWSSSQAVSAGVLGLLQDVSDSTSRADDEPMALPSNCSEKWMKAMSAGLSSSSRRPAAHGAGARHALVAEVAGDGGLEVADGDRVFQPRAWRTAARMALDELPTGSARRDADCG